jgi:hypothetical protein
MKKHWSLWSISLGIICLLASCSPSAHIEKDDTTDFSRFKTYAWVEKDDKGKPSTGPSSLIEQKIKQAVNQELAKTAGWKETNKNPDVLLSYDVLVERSVKNQSDPVYSRSFTRTYYNPYSRRFVNVWYPSQFMGYDNYDVPVREGTVTISMIDADSDKTIWQGWSTSEIDSRKMSSKEIQSSVKAILRKFNARG